MKVEGCDYPEDLLYDVDAGTWARKEVPGVRLGVAPHLCWLSGWFTRVTFKGAGSRVEAGRSLGSVEGPRYFDIVRAPFDCEVLEINSKLASNPRLANRDPFGEGWFALLAQRSPTSSLASLSEAGDSIRKLVKRLGVHCFGEFPDYEMFEVGVECSAVLVRLDEQMSKAAPGAVIHLVSDDPTSEIEMERWQDRTGNRVVETRREGSLRHFIVRKS